jgi:hypothetical protein
MNPIELDSVSAWAKLITQGTIATQHPKLIEIGQSSDRFAGVTIEAMVD